MKELVEKGEVRAAYDVSMHVLQIVKDMKEKMLSILPQVYLDCYQLCLRLDENDPERVANSVRYYDEGLEWAIKLRGSNSAFSQIKQI